MVNSLYSRLNVFTFFSVQDKPSDAYLHNGRRLCWRSGNTLVSHVRDQISNPGQTSYRKDGSCFPLVGSLQYRTMTKLYVLVSSALPTTHRNITDKELYMM